jgi:hypothetical protein
MNFVKEVLADFRFRKLVRAAKSHPFFWIDDVLLTGIIPQELGLPRQSVSSYYSVYKEHLQCCVENDGKTAFGQRSATKHE